MTISELITALESAQLIHGPNEDIVIDWPEGWDMPLYIDRIDFAVKSGLHIRPIVKDVGTE